MLAITCPQGVIIKAIGRADGGVVDESLIQAVCSEE